MRVLLGAFEPFGGETINPSMPAAVRLREDPPAECDIATIVLPVRYGDAWPLLRASVAREAPEIVLLTGLAGGRLGLSIERVAINLDDGRIADNAGEQRVDRPVVSDGPAAYFTTLPAKAMAAASRAAGVEASVSHSAGTFLCNHVLYRLCHHAATMDAGLRCGFVHLPWLAEQADAHPGEPGLALEAMARGLRAALGACAQDGPLAPRKADPGPPAIRTTARSPAPPAAGRAQRPAPAPARSRPR